MADTATTGTQVIGKGVPRNDARLKATGAARYAADVKVGKREPLCGKILRSPHAHANIVSIDTSQAAALPGVFAVVTGEDVTSARMGRFLRDRHVLARGKVRYIGDPVAAVAAIDEETATEALSLIRVEYEPLPAVFTTEEALAAGASLIHDDVASYQDVAPTNRCGNQRNLSKVERGDVDAAFAQADVIVEGTFSTQPVIQGFIETRSCIADVGKDGRVTIWASNKSPFRNQVMVSDGLGIPHSKIRCVSPMIGGDFGGKGATTIEPICALLAIKSGRAVRLSLSRREDMAVGFVRHPSRSRLRLAASRDGRLLGIEGEVIYNCGAYCDGAAGMSPNCGNLQGSYNIPAVRLRGQSVFTNSIPAGHVRGPGVPQVMFPIESLMDELARRLGLDQFEIRRINALREGDTSPGAKKGVMGKHGLVETIDSTAEYARENMTKSNFKQGFGIACGSLHVAAGIQPNDSQCIIKLNEDGSATALTGMPEVGSGHHIVVAQVIGEILGLRADEVNITFGDTDTTPFDTGPGASRGTVRASHAARFAALDARRQLLELAASKLEANSEDLETANKKVYVKGSPDKSVGYGVLARLALTSPHGAIIGVGAREREQWMAKLKDYENVTAEAIFCTHAALVEVDTDTGKVSVLKYALAQDVGFALNPLTAQGQLDGAVAFGLGYALSEEVVINDGRVANPGLVDYHLFAADTIPEVKTIVVEAPGDIGPFGARGLGEAPTGGVAPAIANAIYDAVGVRITDLPITPEKVLRALKEKEKEKAAS
ncbi:MAG: xanthine dehydrogenase family protein molybdopterin-binding subunit [Chloroflexi bacterium]|nr:xanthine dehydrogenase family protein molybdopterin-binding subunit [Chloroflexota bacterium]